MKKLPPFLLKIGKLELLFSIKFFNDDQRFRLLNTSCLWRQHPAANEVVMWQNIHTSNRLIFIIHSLQFRNLIRIIGISNLTFAPGEVTDQILLLLLYGKFKFLLKVMRDLRDTMMRLLGLELLNQITKVIIDDKL